MSEQAGRYAPLLVNARDGAPEPLLPGLLAWEQPFRFGRATLVHGDCFDWLAARADSSIHAVVTDPPYGLQEYTPKEQRKLRNGHGGVWRLPPSFDGHTRSPLPRLVVDPFAGSGATLAAADAVGYASIGIEKDVHYFKMATNAIPALANLTVR